MSIETRHPPEEDLTQANPEKPQQPEDFEIGREGEPVPESTPPDVAHALRRGEEQEREEAQGELSPEREDELNDRLTKLAMEHPELGIDDPLGFIRENSKTAEFTIKGLEFKVARDAFNEMYERWYGANDEERDQMREEFETKSQEYERTRGEYVGESADHILRERIRAADKAAEEKIEKRTWLGRVYDTWKELGELNLDRALAGTRLAPTGKIGKFIARFASVRTAISAGLLGAGIGLGAGSAVGVGAIALRRVFAGLGSGIGSYDLLRNASDKWSRVFGWRREVTPEEARTMPIDEITERLEHLEAWARLNGKKISEIPTYKILLDQYRIGILETSLIAEVESGKTTIEWIESELTAAQSNIEAKVTDLKVGDALMKTIGASIGMIVGSGVLAQGIKAYFGKAEAPLSPADSQIVVRGPSGEAAALNPDGTTQYAPPQEAVAPPTEVPSPAAPQEIIIAAHGGDNVWKILTRALHEKFGNRFDSLDSARKSYLIDSIKDQLAKDPESWGNIDSVKAGERFTFTNLLDDPKMEDAFKATLELSPEKVKSILEHQEAVRDFLREHPGYKLRSGDIDRIIRGELTDANYEADLKGGEAPKFEMIERPPVQPTSPVVTEAPTAARLGLRFAPGLSGQEQEVIAKQVDYFRDKAEALQEKAAILQKFHGANPRFSEFQTELNDEVARLENQANGLVVHAERIEDVSAMKEAARHIGRESYTPYVDASIQARATCAKFEIIPDKSVSRWDAFADAKEASNDAIRNKNFLAAGVETPKGHFAEGFVRDTTGQKLARFEYSPSGEPQSVVYAGRPDLKAAKALLVPKWEQAPSSLEKSKILNRALSLERYNTALRELSRASLLRSPEANFLKKAIGVIKKALGPALRSAFRM